MEIRKIKRLKSKWWKGIEIEGKNQKLCILKKDSKSHQKSGGLLQLSS